MPYSVVHAMANSGRQAITFQDPGKYTDETKNADGSTYNVHNQIIATGGSPYKQNGDWSYVFNCWNTLAPDGSKCTGGENTKLKFVNVSGIDTENILSLNRAFSNDVALEDVEGLQNWQVNKNSNIWSFFSDDYELQHISDISNWNVSSLTEARRIFQYDNKLSGSIDLSNWKLKIKTDNMFEKTNFENINISNWNLNAGSTSMFASLSSPATITVNNVI